MSYLRALGLVLLIQAILVRPLPVVAAESPLVLTISSNNTPLDRRALQRLGEEAFRRIGAALRLTSLPSERSLFAANQGEVDGEGLRVAGLEARYPNLVRVPERFIDISFVAFARDSSISLARGWDSLEPHRVAFINGWKLFEERAGQARTVHKVDQPEQLFRMLQHGRVDLALYTLADGRAMLQDLGLTQLRPLEPSLADVDLYLYLHRRHEPLVPRLAEALRQMKADGTQARILAGLATR